MSYGKMHRRPHQEMTLEFSVSTQTEIRESHRNSSVTLEKYMNQQDKLTISRWEK